MRTLGQEWPRATSAQPSSSPRGSPRLCPEVTAAENPLGITKAALRSPLATLARASASLVTGSTLSSLARSGALMNVVNPAEEGQVLSGGQVGIEGHVLWHVPDLGLRCGGRRAGRHPGDGDLAGICGEQPADQADGRGLAGAVGAEQTIGLA